MSSHTATSPRKPTVGQLRYLRMRAQQTGTTFVSPKTFAEASRQIDEMKGRKRTPQAELRRERRDVSNDMATHRGDSAQITLDELSGYGSTATWARKEPDGLPGARVVHCKRERCDRYIGRPGALGNPFKEGRDGNRQECCQKHEYWLPTQRALLLMMPELRGEVLGCWCAPRQCHGDVLVRLANAPFKPTGRMVNPYLYLHYEVCGEQRSLVLREVDGLLRLEDAPRHGDGHRYLVANGLHASGELEPAVFDYLSQARQLSVIPACGQGTLSSLIDAV